MNGDPQYEDDGRDERIDEMLADIEGSSQYAYLVQLYKVCACGAPKFGPIVLSISGDPNMRDGHMDAKEFVVNMLMQTMEETMHAYNATCELVKLDVQMPLFTVAPSTRRIESGPLELLGIEIQDA